ncbi:neurotrimin-like isoform X2 [Vespula maculifrons]|uniref:Neurotrimin-like isoform X2 n=1 Tax=Vespula maculifrons TaxID=7453 RepID=A0ABD2BTY7_VESMC
MSTYLIFNQLQIIHPQFRPKSRSSVLEPSQNFLSNQDRVFLLKRLWLGHEAKKRLCAEEAPTNCGSRGQLLDYRVIFEGSTEHFENHS